IIEKGKTVPGVIVVGVGSVVIEDDVSTSIEPGEFVFPTEILGAGRAPFTARASDKGAIVLTCSRLAVQELLVTCPPLLEILAGM
ncbi:MAG: hypothetical protein KBF88_12110, partial [Polyangiaceae bacterium]|nr:hypothetical protein [Polyangiaceae bacterium]